jgi:hypothetical protein
MELDLHHTRQAPASPTDVDPISDLLEKLVKCVEQMELALLGKKHRRDAAADRVPIDIDDTIFASGEESDMEPHPRYHDSPENIQLKASMTFFE